MQARKQRNSQYSLHLSVDPHITHDSVRVTVTHPVYSSDLAIFPVSDHTHISLNMQHLRIACQLPHNPVHCLMNTWKAVIHMTDTQQVFRTSHAEIDQIAESLGIHRPLLVAGHFRNLLPSAVVFSGFHPNPDFADCSAGLDLYQNRQCDGIIAIGGGSCIDTAKGILYLLLQQGQHVPPFLAVPTTAGSGSEATDSAVVYVDGKKQSLQDRSMKPCAVILDPSVLTSLPRHQLTSCAMDALCQAVESHWSRKSTAESKVLAEKAIHMLLPGIHMLAQNTESLQTEQAETLLEGSYLAGQAICMTRTTACHAMSYMITKTFGIPHGQAVALTIPYTIQHMLLSASMQDELARLATLLGLNSAENLPAFFLGMLSRLSLLVDLKPDTEALDFLTDSVNPERLSNHPVSLDAETIRELYTISLRLPDPDMLQAAENIFDSARF